MASDQSRLTPDDLLTAAACREALTPALAADWSIRAGDLDWDCRRTLDHSADALALYVAYLATRATARPPPARNGDPARPPAELLVAVGATAAILAEVARAAPPGTRAFHPAGMADPEGFVAMGCEEILIHTDDIATGLGRPFRPPDDFTDCVLRRLFPWAPIDAEPWAAHRWACGRPAPGEREWLGPDRYWHCAPLAEWDGMVKRRTAPPVWI